MESTELDDQNEDQKKNNKITKRKNAKPTQDEKREEQESIFGETESLTPKQLKEKNWKKEREVHELHSGRYITVKQVKNFKASRRQPYQPHFGYDKPFYLNIYKLNKTNGWPEEEHKLFRKRPEVAVWTFRLIYARFGPDMLKYLREANKDFLFAYIRKDKYFQYLNKAGQDMLDDFIQEFIGMSIGYSDWNKFEEDYCTKYKLNRPQLLF